MRIHRNITGKRGFTIVELLVVIMIISLLIALLLPALAQARAAADSVACAARLRSMSLVTQEYANDYAGMLPPGLINAWQTPQWNLQGVNETSCDFGWTEFLLQFERPSTFPTLGSFTVGGYCLNPNINLMFAQLFQCPSAVLPSVPHTNGYYGIVNNAYIQHYAANPNLFLDGNIINYVWGSQDTQIPTTLRQSIIQSPSQCIEFADASQGYPDGCAYFVFNDYYSPSIYTWYQTLLWVCTLPTQQGSTPSPNYIIEPINQYSGNEDALSTADSYSSVNWDYSLRYRHMMTSSQGSGYANAVFADGHVGIIKQNGLHVYNFLPAQD